MKNRPFSLHRLWWLLVPAILSAAAVFFLWQAHPDPQYWLGLITEGRDWLTANPLLLVLAVAVLPGLGFPISPLLILTGLVLGPRFGMPLACLLAIVAQTVCTLWTYFLAAGPLRKFFQQLLLRRWTLPELAGRDALRLTLILRLTPGIPFAVQNFSLGVLAVPFPTYILVSLPLGSFYTLGFVLTGGAIFEGNIGLALTGVFLLVVVILAARMLRKKTLAEKKHV